MIVKTIYNNNIIRYILIFGLSICLLLGFTRFFRRSRAYVIPDNAYVITAQTNLGAVDIIVPQSAKNAFALSGNTPINTTSNSITGYIISGGSARYNIRFPTYQTPEYYQNGIYNETWHSLTFSSINKQTSTVHFLDDSDFSPLNNGFTVNLIFVSVAAFIAYLLIRKRL